MSFRNIDGLSQTLIRMRLVTPDEADRCRALLGPGDESPENLLREMESRGVLTPYQVGRLKKGETDALVLGGYKLIYRNASGSFARVFRACAVDDGRMVGLKLLRQRWAQDPAKVADFHREAEVCRRMKHENIVPIYDVGSEGQYHFFTMEFVEGGNLRDFVRIRGGKLTAVEATRAALHMASGLEYAFGMGISHRDLKLSNVLMSVDAIAKLVDFGLAGDDGISGSVSGTGSSSDGVQRALEYSTLEKSTRAPDGDPRSDLFFLGAMYYELLTGTAPWPSTRDREERKDISRYRNVRPIRSVDPTVCRSAEDVVERLMQINPELRYQTPGEITVDLRALLVELGAGGTDRVAASSQDTVSTDEDGPRNPVVLCIESRVKHQDVLREYLSRRGFRVLMLSDLQRGLNRLNAPQNRPDCVVLMAESFPEGVEEAFTELKQAGNNGPLVSVTVLSEKQSSIRGRLAATETARVLVQPVTLRDLRREIHMGLQKLLGESTNDGDA